MIETHGNVSSRFCICLSHLIDEGVIASASYSEQCLSTNTVAIGEARQANAMALITPRLYLTDHQTAGRGRHGRTWLSGSGNLAFSLRVDASELSSASLQILSLGMGVAVAQAIEFHQAPTCVRLKWPNDLIMGGGKVGGILTECSSSSSRWVVVGVGVNVNDAPAASEFKNEETSGLRTLPRSISQVVGRAIDPIELFGAVVRQMIQWIDALGDSGDAAKGPANDILSEYRSRCTLDNETIHYTVGGQLAVGVCRGVNSSGALIVETNAERMTLTSGEVSRVRTQTT